MQLEQKYRQISINIDNNRHLFKKKPNSSHKHTGACLATANDQSDRSNNRHALHREEHLDFPWPAWVLDVVVIIVWSCRQHSGSVKGGKGEERENPKRNHPSGSNQIISSPKTTPKTSAVRVCLQQYTGGRLNDLAHLESFEHWPGDVVICLFEFHLRE